MEILFSLCEIRADTSAVALPLVLSRDTPTNPRIYDSITLSH